MLVRLRAYPKMRALLDKLPPKMLELTQGAPPTPVDLQADVLETRLVDVTGRIERAKFTGKADKPNVVAMYKEYVERTLIALQHTLAASAAASHAGPRGEPLIGFLHPLARLRTACQAERVSV